jgi:hypothetical protein
MQADNDAIKYSCPSDDDYKDLDNVDQRKYSNMTDKDGPNAQYTLAGCLNMAIELNIFEIPEINGPPCILPYFLVCGYNYCASYSFLLAYVGLCHAVSDNRSL